MKIGNHFFDVENETYVMGILNVTPDSFSDGGRYNRMDAALKQVEKMMEEGAAIIDVGGESTRPGYVMITDSEEISRVVPVIEEIKKRFDIPVSVDSYKSAVAQAAIDAGADMVNDIWGLKYDPDMGSVIAKAGVACCLMHNRNDMSYGSFMEELLRDLQETIALAKESGIADEKIIVDPGVGFGKNYDHNLAVIREVGALRVLGYPVLLGASRKSVVGTALGVPKEDRVVGTLVTTVYGVQQGCSFVRVHDVKENMQAIRMTRAILKDL